MTASTIILGAGGEPVDAVAAAIGDWCRRWPEKVLARDFGVALQTAKKWRRGLEMPAGRHLAAMAERWGRPFIEHAFQSVAHGTLEHRLEALETSFALIRQDLTNARLAEADRPAHRLGAPDGGGVAQAARPALATTRGVIAGIVIGAAVLHMAMPHLPKTVAQLASEAGGDFDDGLRPKAARVIRTAAIRPVRL